MKRFLTILLTTLALTGLLCVGASASSFDGAAAELASIGMLKGSAGGFDLDKAPTRAQAAIMLVRLYGAEDEAKAAYAAGELKCPFTDVNETAAPCVAWLADKGLASGTSADTFGAANPCTAKAYTIFLLRALGYKDNTDFTTDNAQDFAMSLGLLDTSLFSGEFLRDDLAALTYQALGTDIKGGETCLLESLIDSGAIDADAAKPITDKIKAYRALSASGEDMAQGLDTSLDAKMKMTLSVKGQENGTPINMAQKMDAAVIGDLQMILDKDPQMAMNMTVTMSDGTETETEQMEYWLKDGVTYVRSGETAYQMPSGMDMDAIKTLIERSAGQKNGAAMLPFIDSITAETSDGGTVYTLTLSDAFGGMINSILEAVMEVAVPGADMGMELSLDDTSIVYTVDKDGALKNAALDMTMRVGLDASEGADAMFISITVDMDMTMDVKAAGKDVKITFPDFSEFEDIMTGVIGGADGPTSIVVSP